MIKSVSFIIYFSEQEPHWRLYICYWGTEEKQMGNKEGST